MAEKENRTFPVGTGNDGAQYGVTRIVTPRKTKKEKALRKKPCATCPWRKDAKIGRFPADAYRSSASTAYDASMTIFSCHESGADKVSICAGFALQNSENNMSMRMRRSEGLPTQSENPENIELYESYRDMAIANGVDPDDARIAPYRSNDEDSLEVYERMKAANIDLAQSGEDIIRVITDADHDDLMNNRK